MVWRWLDHWLNVDLGIDLGTANSLVYVRGEGIVLVAPSVVAVKKPEGEVLAVGNDAKEMIGKTPENIVAIRPLRDGVIADFDITEKMLKYFIGKVVKRKGLLAPRARAVIGVPSGITEVERRAVVDAAYKSGCKEVELISEPMAAAIGADLPIDEPIGNMIADIGGGTTEVAVISLGGIVVQESIRVAGDEMDSAIVSYIKKHHDMEISLKASEIVKIQIGSAAPVFDEEKKMLIRGYNIVKRLPGELEISSDEVRRALNPPVEAIIGAILRTLERTPPDLSEDIVSKGIVLTGGGSLLRGLDIRVREATGVPVSVSDDPLTTVVKGTGKYVEFKYRNQR